MFPGSHVRQDIGIVVRRKYRVTPIVVRGGKDSGATLAEFANNAGPLLNVARAANIGLEELTGFLEAKAFPRYQWPEFVERFDAFPRTPSLKVQKPELRRQVLERRTSQ